MVLQMARPWKHPQTGIYWFRKRVPDALRARVGKREERFSLKTREPEEAKRLHAAALLEVETRWANLTSPAKTISEREAIEMARPAYVWLLDQHRDNPSEQTAWDPSLNWELFDLPPPHENHASHTEFFLSPPSKASRWWLMTSMVDEQTEEAAQRSGQLLDELGRARLRRAVAAALQSAALDLRKLQQPDYSNPIANAPVAAVRPNSRDGVGTTFSDLIAGWALEKRPVEKTRYSFSRVFGQLEEHVGHQAADRLTVEDIVSWKEALLRQGLSPRTIRYTKLAAVNAVLRWAADNRKLPANVAEKIDIATKLKPGQGRRGYTDEEAHQILQAARKEPSIHLRWLPWLSAYTGARISELCQLRAEDISQVGEYWVLRITADAGSVKNVHSERVVPIHQKLVDEGFLKFTSKIKAGPLFASVSPDRFGNRGGNGTKLVGRWIRDLGLTDPRISPSHSWRHRLKTLGRRHGLAGDLVDAITGHERASVADQYGEYEVAALARELAKLP